MNALLFKAWEGGALGEKVCIRPLQIFERLLKRMDRCIFEPRRILAIAPTGQVLGHRHVADELVARLVVLFLHRQCLVKHEPARPCKAVHRPLLLAVGS